MKLRPCDPKRLDVVPVYFFFFLLISLYVHLYLNKSERVQAFTIFENHGGYKIHATVINIIVAWVKYTRLHHEQR